MYLMEMEVSEEQADRERDVLHLPRVSVMPREPKPAAGIHLTPPGKGAGGNHITERHQPARGVVMRLEAGGGGLDRTMGPLQSLTSGVDP